MLPTLAASSPISRWQPRGCVRARTAPPHAPRNAGREASCAADAAPTRGPAAPRASYPLLSPRMSPASRIGCAEPVSPCPTQSTRASLGARQRRTDRLGRLPGDGEWPETSSDDDRTIGRTDDTAGHAAAKPAPTRADDDHPCPAIANELGNATHRRPFQDLALRADAGPGGNRKGAIEHAPCAPSSWSDGAGRRATRERPPARAEHGRTRQARQAPRRDARPRRPPPGSPRCRQRPRRSVRRPCRR